RVMVADARLLRRLRNVVDIGAERDHWLARAPGGGPRRGDAGDPARHLEAVLLEDASEVVARLDFLEAWFAEAEYHVHHLLREGGHAVDLAHRFLLERGEPLVVGREVDLELHLRPVVDPAPAAWSALSSEGKGGGQQKGCGGGETH